MRIFFIYDGEYPWDVRVEKMCKSMVAKGHFITLICRNYTGKEINDNINSVNIKRLPYFRRGFSRYNVIINFPFFLNPFWLYTCYVAFKSNCYDLIIVRDLPLAPTAIIISKLKKIPVILDMAEPYPETIRQIWKFEEKKFLNYLIRNPYFADIVERFVIKHLNNIFVVSEESRDRLIFMGYKKECITIIRNTPPIRAIKDTHSKNSVTKFDKNKFHILYVGILIPGRGLDVAIKAIKIVAAHNRNVNLIIIGDGPDKGRLKRLAFLLKIEDYIKFLGWIEHDKLQNYFNACDAGLLPFSQSGHHNITIANKFFDFMAAKKPIICSNMLSMKRLLEKIDCGITFKADDEVDLSEKIIFLINNSNNSQRGMKGYRAFKERYNWNVEGKKLESTLKNLAAKSNTNKCL